MNPTSSSPSDLAVAIGSLGALGIESYQLSQGQQVSTSIVGGVPVITSGAATYTWVFVAIAVLLVIWLALR